MKKVLKYLIPFLICVVFVIVVLAIRGAFIKSGKGLITDLCDGFFVSGMLMTAYGVLVFATNDGLFDMLAFAMIKLVDLLKRDMTKVKYRTFYDYHQAQKEKKRLPFLSLIIVGLVFVLVAACLLITIYYYPWAAN